MKRPELSGTRGELDYPPDEFKDVVARLDRMKFQVFIHSIGDRGIRTALDAIEYAEEQNGPRERRDELVHIECLNEKDIPRFKQLGVVACMQPRHAHPTSRGSGPRRSALHAGGMRGRSAACVMRGRCWPFLPIGMWQKWSR